MAATVDKITFTVRIRWWWRPLVWAGIAFFWCYGRFLSDERLEELTGRYAQWVASRVIWLR